MPTYPEWPTIIFPAQLNYQLLFPFFFTVPQEAYCTVSFDPFANLKIIANTADLARRLPQAAHESSVSIIDTYYLMQYFSNVEAWKLLKEAVETTSELPSYTDDQFLLSR